ncbi:MAG: DUF1501 domain-containing protein [Planctomycetaceae bacterium]|nr:DUF1501 domain-containing protein [Planctomycetaceae bacterium]
MLSLPYAAVARPALCDGVSRRDFLRIGSLGLGGLSLAQLLASEARAGTRDARKAVIMIYLVGGPPHQDMFDLKPDAPSEIAGPHRPIDTNVPGIEICELFPQLAARMDKLAVIRSIVDAQAGHDAHQCFTGRLPGRNVPAGGWPQFGSIVARQQGQAERGVPPFVSLCYTCTHGPYNEPGPGYLGVAQSPLNPLAANREDMQLSGITPERLGDRRSLLASMDRIRRDIDSTGKMAGMDAFVGQAIDLLTSSKIVDALDLSKEDPRTVARYGTGDTKVHMDGNGAPRVPQSLLLARRLVEAGCRVVTVNYSKWDWHGGSYNTIFNREREDFPPFDQAVSALVDDLHERGLADDVTVLAWGEFGRTPIISKQVGRDHWPRVSCALMAGGGMRTGQVIGATDRLGGEAVDRPVTFGEVFATLYRNLGIDYRTTTFNDLHGRPQHLLDGNPDPLHELVG